MGLCLSKQSSSPPPLAAVTAEAAAPARSADAAVDVPELTLRELRKATGSFSSARLIGKGHYATVYRASLRSGQAAAAKRLDLPGSCGRWDLDAVAVLRQQECHGGRPCDREKRRVQLRGATSRAPDGEVAV
ncbi:hypothetical protein EJB05_22185, partial [Eragrostis curvula]